MARDLEELTHWQQLILADRVEAERSLKRLAQEDHAHFMALCHRLLEQHDPEVQRLVLWRLGFQGEHDDARVTAIALAALEDPSQREAALIALRTVATPGAFPTLLSYAEAGYFLALKAAAWRARTEEQRDQVLAVARQQALSQNSQLREIAVRVIRTFSSPAKEEAPLLEAAQRYFDEFVFAALRHATVQVLPVLLEMRAQMRPGTAEHQDISKAIEAIQHHAEQA